MNTFIPIVLTALLMAGCQSPPPAPPPVVQPKPAPTVISRTVTSHPPAYRNKGRPAWTYDENRFHEDIQGEANLVEELREPDKYHFFLGAQTVFVGTEENARSGAQIDAINNFKAFLQTTGRNYLQERRGAGLGQQDIREFQTRMDAAATAESRQLKTVRWYFEEERVEWSDGRVEAKWRAWCLAAFSRERADEVWKMMMEHNTPRSRETIDIQHSAHGRGYFGAHLRDLSAHEAPSYRAVIGECVISVVEPHSPADRAGFRIGDVIKTLDGVSVTGSQFRRQISSSHPGAEHEITIDRNGQHKVVKVRLGTIP